MKALRIAVIGLGAWGLCVLERLLCHARREGSSRSTAIDIFEPHLAGPGVHSVAEPEYLLMNTACGQVDLFGGKYFAAGAVASGKTLYEWARVTGYRMIGEDCVEPGADSGDRARPVQPGDFLPRRVLGEYLAWTYQELLLDLPANVSVTLHRAEAMDVSVSAGEQLLVATKAGLSLAFDHVFVTTGHTANRVNGKRPPLVRPYPIAALQNTIVPGSAVALAGMGLVAVDVLTALTVGRGGRFEADGPREAKRYLPSGAEPHITLYSRNGLPFCCRPRVTSEAPRRLPPLIFHEDAIARLRSKIQASTGCPQLDIRRDVLPLLWAEMTIAYHARAALLAHGEAASRELAQALHLSWIEGRFAEALGEPARRFGHFDPDALFFRPDLLHARDSDASQLAVRQLISQDIEQSELGEASSPLKYAFELFRVHRDVLRAAVDFAGLTSESSRDFRERIAPLINRVIVGPPLRRGEELLALLDAGVVEIPLGGSPDVHFDPDTKTWTLRSTRLQRPRTQTAAHVIAGYLEQPCVDRSASALLSQLYEAGRVRPFADTSGAGLDVSRDHHPLDRAGRPIDRMWVLGPLTDGVRYFTQYLPSPDSRFRAFREADDCCRIIFGVTSAGRRNGGVLD